MTTEYQIAKERAERYKEKLDMLLESMSTEERKNTLTNGQKGVSNWLTALPLKEHVFDVRVFDLNARKYRNQELAKCYETNEKEKKRQYNEKVLQIENGIFTPLVFSTEQWVVNVSNSIKDFPS